MNIGVIFAGGVGQRMRSVKLPKQFLEISGKPVIIHTLSVFEQNPEIDAIVIACVADWIDHLQGLVDKFGLKKIQKIVPGGATGQLSIYHGLCAAKDVAQLAVQRGEASFDDVVVLIHDGVRPLITTQLLSDNIQSVHEFGSAITTASVKETVVVGEHDSVKHVVPRNQSLVAKAPQSFYLKDILSAHERAVAQGQDNYIDSCTLMDHYGAVLHTVAGPDNNIKITTIEDYFLMRAILEVRENMQLLLEDE